MKRLGTSLAVCLLLSGCIDAAPDANNIEEAYQNVSDARRAAIIAEFGSVDDAPPGASMQIAGSTERVNVTECEKSQNDLGYICIFNFDLVSVHNGELIASVKDRQARFYKGDAGWLVDES